MDKHKFDAGFRAMCIAFGFNTNDNDFKSVLRVYYEVLLSNKFSDEMFEKCINKLILTWTPTFGRKIPSIKEFLDASGVSASSIAEKAHKAIKNAIMLLGAYEVLNLGNEHKHAVAHECIRLMGGWPVVCQKGVQDWNKDKQKFCDLYEKNYYENIVNQPLMCLSEQRNEEYKQKQLILWKI